MSGSWNKSLDGIRDTLESIISIVEKLVDIEKQRVVNIKSMVEFMEEQQQVKKQWEADHQSGNTPQ